MKRLIFFFLLMPFIVQAQLISIKSLPVVTGDQFLIFPSSNMSMGGVSIALDDPWLEPFINPAKGTYISKASIFIFPTFYSIEENLGGARTIPVTLFSTYKDWFMVISGSFQQVEAANISNSLWFTSQPFGPTDRYSDNKYGFAAVGRKLPLKGFSVGGSLFWSDLNAVGGVDLLYNNSVKIKQDGEMIELKGGLNYQDKTSAIEVVGLYNNLDMMHKVSYWEWIWNADQQIQQLRVDKNLDHTDTYGLYVRYKEQFEKDGPSIGATITYNWKTHPKIPNYEIMNIPRDPGNTWAYNFGLGIGKEGESTRFGIDFIYEPEWSNTWATAEDDINLDDDRVILKGQKTIENNFTFSNWIARAGFNKSFGIYELSAGLEVYKRSYNLDQYDYIIQSIRSQDESWTESTFSWGAELHFSRFNLKYSGRVSGGAGIPRVNSRGIMFESGLIDKIAAADFIAAPSGKLSVSERSVYTHQFIIQIPLNINSNN